MCYRDNIKYTIQRKIEELGIPVKLSYIEDLDEPPIGDFPKLLFDESVGDGFKVIDFESYDKFGRVVEPNLIDIVGLFMCTDTVTSEIVDYTDNIITLKEPINKSMVKYMSELTIQKGTHREDINGDYCFISSLFSRTKRLNAIVVEHYRRYEIGIFCKNDEDEAKMYRYMTQLGDIFDKDFVILDSKGEPTKEIAYIFTPLKFDITEHGRQDRLIYGSMMIKTYK